MNSKKASKAGEGLAIRHWHPEIVPSAKAEEWARSLRQWGWEKENKKTKRVVGLGSTKRVVGLGW